MKTKNNVLKTNLKVALTVVFFLIAGTTFGARKSDVNTLTEKPVRNSKLKTSVIASTPVAVPVFYRKVFEQSLQLESWMVYGKLFTASSSSFDTTKATGKPMELFDKGTTSENALEFEPWMMESKFWE